MPQLTVEQDTGSNIAYKELVAVIGAYDVDINDNLTLSTQPPTYGVLTLKREVRSVPKLQDCSAPSSDSEEVVVPCGLELPQDVVSCDAFVYVEILLNNSHKTC